MKIFENQAKPTLTEYHREHQKFGNPLPYAAFCPCNLGFDCLWGDVKPLADFRHRKPFDETHFVDFAS